MGHISNLQIYLFLALKDLKELQKFKRKLFFRLPQK